MISSKMIRGYIGLAFALLCSGNALAAGSTGNISVSSISVENGHLYIQVASFDNPDNCGFSTLLVVPSDTPKQDHFLSIALTALASGKAISAWVSGCESSPWENTVARVVSLGIQA